MLLIERLKGVGVTLSGLIGSCYGDAWNITFLDPCEAATEHLADCLDVSTAGECSGGGECDPRCEGTVACSADCINDASCEAIKDAFSGMPTEASKPFLDCAIQCATIDGAKD